MIVATTCFAMFIVVNLNAARQTGVAAPNSLGLYFVCLFCTESQIVSHVTATLSNYSVLRTDSKNTPSMAFGSTSVITHPETCRNLKHGKEKRGRWYNFSAHNFQFYAFSAVYYDPANATASNPAIRLTAVTTMYDNLDPGMPQETKKLLKGSIPVLVCFLYYERRTHVAVMKSPPLEIGFGGRLRGGNAFQYIYECALESNVTDRPIAVAISTLDDVFYERRHTDCMPVVVAEKPANKKDFLVCGPVAYGSLDPYRLIEWFEMLKILGVDHVVVYDIGVFATARRVFEHYVREGFLDFRKTVLFDSHEPYHHKLHCSPTINDCLYRNMHAYNYIVVIDFDEMIVPIGQEPRMTLRKLIDVINIPYGSDARFFPASYSFPNAYFLLEIPPDANESRFSAYLGYRKRAPVSERGLYVKSIHNPLACSHAHNHYCWGTTPAFRYNVLSHEVDPNIALNCHYKTCNLQNETCQELINKSTPSDLMMKYKSTLSANIQKTLYCYLNLAISDEHR